MAASANDKPGGYDVSFVAPLDKEYECPICLLALKDPVQTPCGHSFCKSCFDRVVQQQGGGDSIVCPLDKMRIAARDVFKDAKVKRIVLALKVLCTNKEAGIGSCKWKGELNYFQNHLDECEFVTVECSQKCGKTMPRYLLNGHFHLHCPRSARTCSYCKVDFERQHMRKHESTCGKRPIKCTLNCGANIPREDMHDHVSESGNCPNTMMPCVFKNVGCDVTVKRQEIDQHLTAEMVQHQVKQQHMIDKLIDENKKLKQKLDLHLFTSSEETVLSSSGRTMIKLFVKRSPARGYISSPPFRAHHTGYEAKLDLHHTGTYSTFELDILKDCWIAQLVPTKGNRDDKLSWPFPFRYTITLLDRQTHQDDIKTTVDPATFDNLTWSMFYCKPDPSNTIVMGREYHNFMKRMFHVPKSLLLSAKYMKNDNIVMVVEVDN